MAEWTASQVEWGREHPFNRAGLASLDELETKEWRSLFQELEFYQNQFLLKEREFRSKGYRWASDTLHTCIRVWEYPFVYHHLKTFRQSLLGGSNPTVVDLGSGVTFFPFAVANLGYEVVAVDRDPICGVEHPRAVAALPLKAGSITFRCADGASVPLPEGSVACVYCISLLEHLPAPVSVVEEAARMLRAGGLFVLTFDVDLNGAWSLGPSPFDGVRSALRRRFDFVFPEVTIHPRRMLTSDNSPYPYYGVRRAKARPLPWPLNPDPGGRGWRVGIRARVSGARNSLLGRRRILASTYGACLKKK